MKEDEVESKCNVPIKFTPFFLLMWIFVDVVRSWWVWWRQTLVIHLFCSICSSAFSYKISRMHVSCAFSRSFGVFNEFNIEFMGSELSLTLSAHSCLYHIVAQFS